MDFQKLTLPDLSQAVVLDDELDKKEKWLTSRVGKFTSSEAHRLMTCLDKIDVLPKGAETYILEKVIEIKTGGKGVKTYYNESMERGNEKEIDAVARFEKEKYVECYDTGENQQFIQWTKFFGGTPDGLFGKLCGIEIKCPDSKTHFFRLKNVKTQQDLKKHEPSIYWQCIGNMLATRRKKWYFIDFDDRFENPEEQIHIVEVIRDEEDVELLKTRIRLAEKRKQQYLKMK